MYVVEAYRNMIRILPCGLVEVYTSVDVYRNRIRILPCDSVEVYRNRFRILLVAVLKFI